jgi:hypothetical protein
MCRIPFGLRKVMKWVLRTWVFGGTLVLGLCVAMFVDLITFEPSPVPVEEFASLRDRPDEPINGTGVRVTYVGWEPAKAESYSNPYLKFLVHNDSWEPLTYVGHGPDDMLAELRSNGREIDMMGRCGTGMRSHILLPGASVVVNVRSFEFSSRPGSNDLITAGFSLRRPFEERNNIYWSEPVALSEEFRIGIEIR